VVVVLLSLISRPADASAGLEIKLVLVGPKNNNNNNKRGVPKGGIKGC